MAKRSINEHDDGSYLPIIPLFLRISAGHIQEKQRERKKCLKKTLICLLICILIIWFYEIDNEMYNALKGPFYMNSNQFIQHIQFHNKQIKFWKRILFSFYEKYFQIELGENSIEKYGKHPFLQLITEPTIRKILYPNHLYVKLAIEEEIRYHNRLSFNFQLYSIKTLKCILHQIKIPSDIYHTWMEKSMYIRTIEQFYDQNPTLFNKNVLIKCGILIGYLYNPRGEHYLLEKFPSLYKFNPFDVAIDASYSYSLTFFIFGCIVLSGLLIKILIHFLLYIFYRIRRIKINIHSNIKKQFEILGINSLYSLRYLLFESIVNNLNYRYYMFIIEDKYLIIFNVNFDEYNMQRLSSFYNKSPFIVISISSIIQIHDNAFFIDDENHEKWIYFSSVSDDINKIRARKWLHDQLMSISSSYRHRYVEAVRKEKEKEIYARQFAWLVAREEEIQRNKMVNSIDRMTGIIKSASPRFIAQFCLTDHPTVQTDQINLLDSQCSICLNEFTVGKKYAQWPCLAQHYFHCDCMLGVLRESNKCPLCRYAVESTPSLFQNIFHQFFP